MRGEVSLVSSPVLAAVWQGLAIKLSVMAVAVMTTTAMSRAAAAAAASRDAAIPAASIPDDHAPVPGTPCVLGQLGLELLWISPGKFVMGSSPDEAGRDQAEGPPCAVTLTQGFWLGKTEVTQAQYEAVTGANPSHFKALGGGAPVERVSWLDAMEFCRLLTERERAAGRLLEGYAFTLPTEAQWEYACRAGATDSRLDDLDVFAWHEGNSDESVHLVGLKEPNAWGFFDMQGNVLEWCRDWFGNYKGGKLTDPTGPARGHFRIARGGSWRVGPAVCRPAARAGGSPGRQDYTIGFRLALCAVATRGP